MKKIDVKEIGVPNVCFSLPHEGKSRIKKYKKQRIKRGFDDTETYDLSHTISSFIIPRLERYEKLANEMLLRDKELTDKIKEFLCALKLITRDEGSHLWNEEENKQVQKGLNHFPDIFMTLWW